MSSRAFINAAVPQDLLVTQTPEKTEVAVAGPGVAVVLLTRFVIFPLALLPLALYAYGVTHTVEGLPPADYARLLKEPAEFAAILPRDAAFFFYAGLPWILAVVFFGRHLLAAMRNRHLSVTLEGITLYSRCPARAERLDISGITEIHIRDYRDGRGYQPHLAHFLAVPAGEGMFDFIAGIEKSDGEGLRKIYMIADAIGRLHNKPVKHFGTDGNEVERQP